MIAILFRTLIIYLILSVAMRLMGKRQIGELEVTDLVTTLLLSEIAALPITNTELPLSHALIPMITLLFLEIASSVVLIFFPRLKPLVSARPTVLMKKGELDQRALRSMRLSIDELMSEIRRQGFVSIEQIDCAILEKNGQITLLPKAEHSAPSLKDLGIRSEGDALMHIVYNNGAVSRAGLSLIGRSEAWLLDEIRKNGYEPKSLFCVSADERGHLYFIPKQGETDA